ncbi:hypothetical protein J2S43_001652 [Catenuloplanes nepalensis]|uniref:Peptidase C14 caspase domain-containing protein n=1 Tax=Catenuloplanes nepalensis TaxID=587533 RepID=A0ABT9MNZ1_9ACTN|nr:caspase family protein [Catenuloplanes nepalensis]MDP9793140.1 hypothetical protein [Catenuloplanes nepalensis]
MRTLYALMVGIDAYHAVRPLRGCVRDVRAARAHLDAALAPGMRLAPLMLLDEQATRAAIVGAIRSHLGQAGPDDVALLWFSGHGSDAPAPDWARVLESTGRVQTLVCVDSRTGDVPDLWDKELSVLLDEVADRAGHVTVVLDSCHSDGATRELVEREPAARTRSVPPAAPRTLDSVRPEVIRRAMDPRPAEHVVLAACRSFEAAEERLLDGETRGVFSWSLLRSLQRLGPDASYRDLMLAAQTEVAMRASRQSPQARPRDSALLGLRFLGGAVATPGSGVRMRFTRAGWMIDSGAVHGLPAGPGVRIGVRGGEPGREADVVEVRMEESRVEPIGGWRPAPDEQFPVVVTAVPLPPTTVAVDGDDAGATARLTEAVHGSVHLRVVPPGAPEVPDLRVRCHRGGTLSITDQHGERLEERTHDGPYGTVETLSVLEHIARWRLVRELRNPASALADPVRIELLAAEPGQRLIPTAGEPLIPDPNGEYVVSYRQTPAGWAPPELFIRLRNRGDEPLYCALLDLTPRFKVHAALFPGDFIEAGATGSCLGGRRITAFLPDGLAAAPGVTVRDRLKLIVAEEQFSVEPYHLPALGRPLGRRRGALSAAGLIERLGGAALHRDVGDPVLTSGYDWTTTEVTLTTVVPPR